MKRAKGSEVSISHFGQTQWDLMSATAGLKLRLAIKFPAGLSPTSFDPFQWDDAPEGSNCGRWACVQFRRLAFTPKPVPLRSMFVMYSSPTDQLASYKFQIIPCRYMPYLKRMFPLPGRATDPLVWLEAGNSEKDLLSLAGQEHKLHYAAVRGNTDAAIITRASYDCHLPRSGLCILIELKKAVDRAAVFQALCQLVMANCLSPGLQPVVVLTDLQDDWQLFWMDGDEVGMGCFGTRADAVVLVRDLVQHAAELATSIPGSLAAVAEAPGRSLSKLPPFLGARRPACIPSSTADLGADACLADLAGMLPEEELAEAQAMALVQQLRHLPVFNREHDEKASLPWGMYS